MKKFTIEGEIPAVTFNPQRETMNSALPYPLPLPPPLPGPSQVRSANLQRLTELVDARGLNCKHLLETHGIHPQATEKVDLHIDCQSLVNLLEDCANTLKDPLFGIRLAQLQQPDLYGCVTTLCQSAPTLRDAIACLVKYVPLFHSSESILDVVEGSRIAELRWSMHSDLGTNDQATCHGLLLNLKVLRLLAGHHFTPSYAILPLGAGRNAAQDIARAVGCPIRVGRGYTGIAFPAALLVKPIHTADPVRYAFLQDSLNGARPATELSLAQQVTRYLYQALDSDPTITACARRLSLSPRTLQARLRREGTSFSEILEGKRLERARQMLARGDTPIAEIADMLGYTERTSFDRAFRRWTGLSPRQFMEGQAGKV